MKHTELLHSILEKSGAIQHKGRLKSVMVYYAGTYASECFFEVILNFTMNFSILARSL